MLSVSTTTTTQVQLQETINTQLDTETVLRLQQMQLSSQQFKDYCDDKLQLSLSDVISDRLVESFKLEGWSPLQSEELVFNLISTYKTV